MDTSLDKHSPTAEVILKLDQWRTFWMPPIVEPTERVCAWTRDWHLDATRIAIHCQRLDKSPSGTVAQTFGVSQ